MTQSRDIIKNTGKKYLALTIFCIVFAVVYESMSHGVYSNYMILAFLFPLIGGVVPCVALLALKSEVYIPEFSEVLYHSGVITLMIGSIFEGVLYIYGTTNSLSRVFWAMGGTLAAVGALSGAVHYFRTQSASETISRNEL